MDSQPRFLAGDPLKTTAVNFINGIRGFTREIQTLAIARFIPGGGIRHGHSLGQVIVRNQAKSSATPTIAGRRIEEKDPARLQPHQIDQLRQRVIEGRLDVRRLIQDQ